MRSVSMQHGKARHLGGALYSGGTGSATIDIANCNGNAQYFESFSDGGFLFVANPSTTLTTSSCCYQHLYAVKLGGFVFGDYIGTFTSTCTNNVTDNTPSNIIGPGSCGYDEYLNTGSSTCISNHNILMSFRM